jgi:hypothetical protein
MRVCQKSVLKVADVAVDDAEQRGYRDASFLAFDHARDHRKHEVKCKHEVA